MDEILSAQQNGDHEQLPRLCLNAIGIAAAITDALHDLGEGGMDDLLGGPSDRLPLALASLRLGKLSDMSMLDLWREIIESWVLAQHARWSVARSGDETQRLRVAVDEGGCVRLRPKLSGPFRPTPDRFLQHFRYLQTLDCLSVRAMMKPDMHWDNSEGRPPCLVGRKVGERDHNDSLMSILTNCEESGCHGRVTATHHLGELLSDPRSGI